MWKRGEELWQPAIGVVLAAFMVSTALTCREEYLWQISQALL